MGNDKEWNYYNLYEITLYFCNDKKKEKAKAKETQIGTRTILLNIQNRLKKILKQEQTLNGDKSAGWLMIFALSMNTHKCTQRKHFIILIDLEICFSFRTFSIALYSDVLFKKISICRYFNFFFQYFVFFLYCFGKDYTKTYNIDIIIL